MQFLVQLKQFAKQRRYFARQRCELPCHCRQLTCQCRQLNRKLQSIFFANPLPDYPDCATANACFRRKRRSWASEG